MYNAENTPKVLEYLRDFFYFGTQDRMQRAYEQLCSLNGDTTAETDWAEEQYCFNRLFVGPASPLAPIVASFYLEEDGAYNGQTTKCVRDIYQLIGLELPEDTSIPEDSLPMELDACRYLILISRVTDEAVSVYGYFVRNHLNEWIHLFLEKTDRQEKTPAVEYMLFILKRWVKSVVNELIAQEV